MVTPMYNEIKRISAAFLERKLLQNVPIELTLQGHDLQTFDLRSKIQIPKHMV